MFVHNFLITEDQLVRLITRCFIGFMIGALGSGVVALIFVKILYDRYKRTNAQIYGDNSTGSIQQIRVKVISKSTTPHPMSKAHQVNKIVFETTDGERIELAIRDADIFDTTIESDTGTLFYYGNRFMKFKRDLAQ